MWYVYVLDAGGETQVNDLPFNSYQVAELIDRLGPLPFLLRPAL